MRSTTEWTDILLGYFEQTTLGCDSAKRYDDPNRVLGADRKLGALRAAFDQILARVQTDALVNSQVGLVLRCAREYAANDCVRTRRRLKEAVRSMERKEVGRNGTS